MLLESVGDTSFELAIRCAKGRSVSYYAERLCVSDGYLQTIIKEEMHRPVMYWVNQVTVNKLKVMLKEEGQSLEAVAKVMGFGGASQMIRFFKRETGMTPAEFRKKWAGR